MSVLQLILQIAPVVLRIVSEAADAVEAIGGAGTGEAKKAAVLDTVDAAYDLQMATDPGAIPIDKLAFRKLASDLVETSLTLKQARDEREG